MKGHKYRECKEPLEGVKCYNCNGDGHISRKCPQPQKIRANRRDVDKLGEGGSRASEIRIGIAEPAARLKEPTASAEEDTVEKITIGAKGIEGNISIRRSLGSGSGLGTKVNKYTEIQTGGCDDAAIGKEMEDDRMRAYWDQRQLEGSEEESSLAAFDKLRRGVDDLETQGGYTRKGLELREKCILKQRNEFYEDHDDQVFNKSWNMKRIRQNMTRFPQEASGEACSWRRTKSKS